MAKIELVSISKKFVARAASVTAFPFPTRDWERPRTHKDFAIRNLNLTIPHAQTLVILGPSGCGKTTILKLIAGLLAPDAGEILFNGKTMNDVPPGERRLGFLFQNYALYPNLTVKKNILSYFFFRKQTPTLDAEARAKYQRTSELLGVEMKYLEDRFPPTLSGGERQRVALGRCITRDPVVFLLDEPFSNLDPKLREKYRVNLKELLTQFNITTVYVTHDQHEAFVLADRMAIMDAGKIEQIGTYEEIYARPKNIFIAEFLNLDFETPPINLIAGERVAPGLRDTRVGIRPEDVIVSSTEKPNAIRATILKRQPLPLKGIAILTMRVGDDHIIAPAPLGEPFSINESAWLAFKKYHVFDERSGTCRRTEERDPSC